jgi:hypothetical protein
MLITRFRGRFRERATEWVLGFGMMFWGLVTLASPELFNQQYFYPLSLIMTQPLWGVLSLLVGSIRLISLAINGLWRPTAHFRAIASILSILVWFSLLLASMGVPERALGIPTFAMLVSLDIFSLWWAAGDARVADELVKKRREVAKNGA